MEAKKIIFWNVDTQNDFVEPWGKLYVPGAEMLKPVWAQITQLAKKKKIRVVNSADFHYTYSAEISEQPNMVSTFPPHCLIDTKGAEYVAETNPGDALVYDWKSNYEIQFHISEILKSRNIVIRKDAFDVFTGNKFTSAIVGILKPEVVFVYGVSTNVCVDFAVMGLTKRVKNVFVVEDAIKELPGIPLPFEKWQQAGVKLITFNELKVIV